MIKNSLIILLPIIFLIAVFVFLFSPTTKNFDFPSVKIFPDLPEIKAKSYGVFLFPELKLVLGQNINFPYPLASITKFFTAYFACQTKIFDKKINITLKDLNQYGYLGGFQAGESFFIQDLVRIFLKNSSNLAAEVVWQSLAEKEKLIQALNQELNTEIKIFDGSGLNPQNQASVKDLALFFKKIFQECPLIFSWSAEKSQIIQGKYVQNLNGYVNNFLGGKIGALPNYGYNFAGLFDDGKNKYLVIVFGADSFFSEVDKILRFLNPQVFNNFNFYCANDFKVTDENLRACRTNPILDLADYVEINLGNVRGRVIKNGKVVREYYFLPQRRILGSFESGLYKVFKKDNFLILENKKTYYLGLKDSGPIDIFFESEPEKFLDFLTFINSSTQFLIFF